MAASVTLALKLSGAVLRQVSKPVARILTDVVLATPHLRSQFAAGARVCIFRSPSCAGMERYFLADTKQLTDVRVHCYMPLKAHIYSQVLCNRFSVS